MSENLIKAPKDFRCGVESVKFEHSLNSLVNTFDDIVLDLSEVEFMDSFTFRIVFDFFPDVKKIIPPKNKHTIDRYNDWLDSKKGLLK